MTNLSFSNMKLSKYFIKFFSKFFFCIHLPFAALIISLITFILHVLALSTIILEWSHLQNESNYSLNSQLMLIFDTNIIFCATISSIMLACAVWNQKPSLILPFFFFEPIFVLGYLLSAVQMMIRKDYWKFCTFLGIFCMFSNFYLKKKRKKNKIKFQVVV